MRLYSNERPAKFIDIEVRVPDGNFFRFKLSDTDICCYPFKGVYRRRICDSCYIKFYGYTFDLPKEFING